MKKINCIVADDEELAREVIENHIGKIDGLHLLASSATGTEVYQLLKTHTVDLLFLDIQMPDLTGIELLRTLKNPPPVIMTTAYREFALEGYELNVIDYLLKPVSFDRFLRAIDKYTTIRDSGKENVAAAPFAIKNDPDAFIYVRSENKMVRILLKDILYIEGLKEYVKVHTRERSVITYHSLTYFEEKLSVERFMRIHRSFIIALGQISSYSMSEIEIGQQHIPIGITYAKEVIKRLEARP
ncbi:LytTR family DNA-binding domain-containing protein [Pedobacter sp. L105]|uniref:LytR/AlgR family response regulator transcription factor n=1 Tax=Pedobacter sp. L105 TaxID=1641871 RepID=UPI00131B758D|nr:LytTR family DNA-binding domain-containing protein [Pedobacter sp. L105]